MISQSLNLCACGCGQETAIAAKDQRKSGARRGFPNRFIAGHNLRGGRIGSSSPRWRGGRTIAANGYVLIYSPGHPRALQGKGAGYVAEHILVVERALGHSLAKTHPVHHVDENPANNANGNLVACENNAYHMLLHRRQRALDACGDANALPCKYCRAHDTRDNLVVMPRRRKGAKSISEFAYHRACHAQYALELYHRRAS